MGIHGWLERMGAVTVAPVPIAARSMRNAFVYPMFHPGDDMPQRVLIKVGAQVLGKRPHPPHEAAGPTDYV
jgi:hypothetical protein